MATVEASIVTDLKTQATVTAHTGTRIYEYTDEIKSGNRIIVTPVSNPQAAFTQTLSEAGVARVSVYCHGDTVSDAVSIGEAVEDVYRTRVGTIGSHTVHQIEISDGRVLRGHEARYLVDLIVHWG